MTRDVRYGPDINPGLQKTSNAGAAEFVKCELSAQMVAFPAALAFSARQAGTICQCLQTIQEIRVGFTIFPRNNQRLSRMQFPPAAKLFEHAGRNGDVALLVVLHREAVFRRALNTKDLRLPADVRELGIAHFVLAKNELQKDLKGYALVVVSFGEKALDLLRVVHGGKLQLALWSARKLHLS